MDNNIIQIILPCVRDKNIVPRQIVALYGDLISDDSKEYNVLNILAKDNSVISLYNGTETKEDVSSKMVSKYMMQADIVNWSLDFFVKIRQEIYTKFKYLENDNQDIIRQIFETSSQRSDIEYKTSIRKHNNKIITEQLKPLTYAIKVNVQQIKKNVNDIIKDLEQYNEIDEREKKTIEQIFTDKESIESKLSYFWISEDIPEILFSVLYLIMITFLAFVMFVAAVRWAIS